MMRCAVLFASLTLLASCASLDNPARSTLTAGRAALAEHPAEALRHAREVQARFPQNPAAHVLAARALEALGQPSTALTEWHALITEQVADRTTVHRAHEGVLRTAQLTLGDLPSVLGPAPDDATRQPLLACFQSCDALLAEDETHPGARLQKAECLLRLGLVHQARPWATRLVREEPSNSAARYLLCRIKEQQIGMHAEALDTYQELLRCAENTVRRQAAGHLIYLLADPGLASVDRDNVRGALLRLAREAEAPALVVEWQARYEAQREVELVNQRLTRQIEEVAELRQRGSWQQGFDLLAELPEEEPSVQEARQRFTTMWWEFTLGEAEAALAAGELTTARTALDVTKTLPTAGLSAGLIGRASQISAAVTRAEWDRRVAAGLSEAQAILAQGDHAQALGLLDELLVGEVPQELRGTLCSMRAEALAGQGRRREALEQIEEGGRPTQPRYQRLYGILLAEAHRSQQAQQVLESLPVGYLTGEALDALVETYLQQGAWDAVLGRLLGLASLTDHQRKMRRQACLEASRARLHRNDPEEALRILVGHLDPEERVDPAVWELTLETMLESHQLQAAHELLMSRGDAAPTLSPALAQVIQERLAGELSDEARFPLLTLLEGDVPGLCTTDLARLWPRFGDYFPPHGSYALRYRLTEHMQEDSRGEPSYMDLTITWRDDHFLMRSPDGSTEEWRSKDGVWLRKTPGGEHQIPVCVGTTLPYPERRYAFGETSWNAEIVEAGTTVVVDQQTFLGCLRVRLMPAGAPGESVFLDLAPGVGEVRRQIYEAGALRFTRELVESTPPTPSLLVRPTSN